MEKVRNVGFALLVLAFFYFVTLLAPILGCIVAFVYIVEQWRQRFREGNKDYGWACKGMSSIIFNLGLLVIFFALFGTFLRKHSIELPFF